jgi:hypothetical protein
MLLMMSVNIARNMYSSQKTITFPTLLHLVGHFVYYILMHGTMNIKNIIYQLDLSVGGRLQTP